MTRKSFLASALSGAANLSFGGVKSAVDPCVGKPLEKWTPGHFTIHAIYTGCGEQQFIIFPDGTTMLLDCGDCAAMTRGDFSAPIKPREPYRLGGDWVGRYVARANPNGRDVDYAVASHWHNDHVGTPFWCTAEKTRKINWWSIPYKRSGFGIAIEDLKFRYAVDRGYPEYDDPIYQNTPDHALPHWRNIVKYIAKRDGTKIEKFRLGAVDQFRALRGEARDFSVFNICANGRIAFPDGRVVDCYADRLAATPKPKYLNENGMSLGMVFTYGKFKYYTAGDFSDSWKLSDGTVYQIEDTMAEAVSPCSVAKVNHHACGGMPKKIVAALRPKVWLSCILDCVQNQPAVLARLSDRSLYPGDRLICPTVFPPRRQQSDAGKPWMKDVAPESFDAGHVVIDVPPGGETFSVSYLTADDESMRVKARYTFRS